MKKYEHEKEYMRSVLYTTVDQNLYNIYWGDTDEESFSILCNASEEDIKKELHYFKEFRDDTFIWKFEDFLNERGYTANRYFVEEPIYINFNECD